MPKVIAQRFFISAQFGNVHAGRVLEASDLQAQAFITHGFVKLVKPEVSPKVKTAATREGQDPLDFTPPAGGRQGAGSSSQAGLVLPKRIVKKSGPGVKPARRKRAKKKP